MEYDYSMPFPDSDQAHVGVEGPETATAGVDAPSQQAIKYFNSFPPEQQAQILASWGGNQGMMELWYQNALAAGAVPPTISQGGSEGGGVPQGTTPSSGWTPKNKAELQEYARSRGWSEDYQRFDDATVLSWIQNYWDAGTGTFRSAKTDEKGNPLEGGVEKPDDTPPGWAAWGSGNKAIRTDDPRYLASQGQQPAAAPEAAAPAAPTTGYTPPVTPTAAPTTAQPTGTPGAGTVQPPPGAPVQQFSAPAVTQTPAAQAPAPAKIEAPDVWKNTGVTGGNVGAPAPVFTPQRESASRSPQFFSGGGAAKRGWMGGGQWVTSDERLKDRGLGELRFSSWRR
jgi:hypothetical protein